MKGNFEWLSALAHVRQAVHCANLLGRGSPSPVKGFGFERGHPQPGLSGNPTESLCEKRALAHDLGPHHHRQRRDLSLADTYTAGGEVLMGTLRWEKERAERVANEVTEVAGKLKRVRLDAEEAELEV